MNKYYEQDRQILNSILKDYKLTKTKLAQRLDVSYSHINMILGGYRGLGKRTLASVKEKYPEYFDTTILVPDELSQDEFKAVREKLRMSQSEFALALGSSQALIAKIEKKERKVSKSIIRALKELLSSGEDKCTLSILYAPHEALNGLYLNNNKLNTERVVIDKRLLPDSVHSKCKIVTIDDNSCYPEFNIGDKVIIDPTDNTLANNKIQVIRVNDVTYIGRIQFSPDKIKCVPLNEKYDSFYINKDTSVIATIIPRIRF